ncbi:GNAT family protein [Phytomonospora sp. NPDC050363]|uniref:GNAT family N-acetyltransferase n=1 Tax=Phytomonospora sp. NPDC050363 TaxID=3155642 RepID=UPI0033FF061B
MLNRHWPLRGLTVRTERLELRLPDENELAELADVAAAGVHEPGVRPFLTEWTSMPPEEVARGVVQRHWARLGSWRPDSWQLELVAFADGRPIGCQDVRAKDFAVLREITSGSWLGKEHHRRGYGTEMRAAALHLVFGHLGGEYATTMAFLDNEPSMGVSLKLGYRRDGLSRDNRDGETIVSQRMRLSREDWEKTAATLPPVEISGVEPCLSLFGVTG